MHRFRPLILAPVLLAIGCSDDPAEDASETTTTAAVETTTTVTEPEVTTTASVVEMDIVTVPPTEPTGVADPNATGSILMLKLHVGDIAEAEAFYGNVFGATVAIEMGEGVHIVTLPGGGPGMVLIESGPDDADQHGAFIMQVPNLEASRDLAVANGATLQGEFAGNPGGDAARSIDLLDPWGNQVEILQIG